MLFPIQKFVVDVIGVIPVTPILGILDIVMMSLPSMNVKPDAGYGGTL